MAVLEVVDLVVAGAAPGVLDEFVGHPPQLIDLGAAQHVGDDEIAVLAIEGDVLLG